MLTKEQKTRNWFNVGKLHKVSTSFLPDVEHPRILVEGLLRAVAVVDGPVDDQDPLHLRHPQQLTTNQKSVLGSRPIRGQHEALDQSQLTCLAAMATVLK